MQSLLASSLLSDVALTAVPTLGASSFLLSPWKPIVLIVPYVPWMWLISKIFDKHCARFYLPRENWNLIHLSVGLVALIVALAMPIPGEGAFWAGLGAIVFLLSADVGVFMYMANHDDRVPADHHLRFDLSKLRESQDAKAAAKKQGKVALLIKRPDKSTVEAPLIETPEFEIRVAAENLFLKALQTRASQVDLGPGQGGNYSISYLVDGIKSNPENIPAANAAKIIDFWKGAAKLDLNERRKRLTGDATVEQDTEKKKVRVTSMGAQAGMRATLLIEPEAQVRRKEKDMGLLEPQLAELKAIVEDHKGVVLLGGMPDGGRTTTLYAITKMHDAYTKNVQTVELEVQDTVEGVRQNFWDAGAEGPDFSTLVRSILRRDPDVVSIAELMDGATAKEIARIDQERTRTYVAMRAESAIQAILQWFKAIGDNEMAGKCLHGAMAQRLVRKLCTNCKVAYNPSADMVKKLGLPPDRIKTLFKKGGQVLIKNKPEICPVCNGVGYVGQEACFEVFRLSDSDRALMRAGDLKGLQVELRKRGLPTIQQSALRKAIDGITSVEEITRVTTPEGGGAAKPATASTTATASAPKPAPAAAVKK